MNTATIDTDATDLVTMSVLFAAMKSFLLLLLTMNSAYSFQELIVTQSRPELLREPMVTPTLFESASGVPQHGQQSVLERGVQSYVVEKSSTLNVALQERKIPTKEEIEAKKRNFNVIFWVRFACAERFLCG